MAYVLSVATGSPFRGIPACDPFAQPSTHSLSSIDTVKHHRVRSISSGSHSSASSSLSPPSPPSLPTSGPPLRLSTLGLSRQNGLLVRPNSLTLLRDVSRSSLPRENSLPRVEESASESIDTDTDKKCSKKASTESLHTSASEIALPESPSSPKKAFKRWMSTLRRKRPPQLPAVRERESRWTLDDFDPVPASTARRGTYHSKADSHGSSMRCVTALRSATATLASTSIAAASRRTGRHRRGNRRSSVMSGSDVRTSFDTQRSFVDEAAIQRAKKRRRKLEELIRSEESYVADLKALSNAYFTILGSETNVASFARSSAQKTISGLLQLHDELLGQLHEIVPFAEYDQSTANVSTWTKSHTRWHSFDGLPSRSQPVISRLATIRQGRRSLSISRSSDEDFPSLTCAPHVAMAVAKLFSQLVPRFSVYEDFGAHYDQIQQDIDETQRGINDWHEYDRAIETISSAINPFKTRESNRKKAMTVKDLLIKPIQRLPRYELLFGDLCKLTPVCDDPDANAAVQLALSNIGEACQRMNVAKDNPERARMLETTWLIGDRLTFSSQVPKAIYLQLLGQVVLCGCLHIAYRGKERVRGCYLICILFESTLFLATADDDQPNYSTTAGIALANATIQETDNGKGLQCHTTPHSWKMVFESTARMFEIIFTACSAVEATVWRDHIGQRIEQQSQAVAEGTANVFELQSPLVSKMKSVGRAFGKPGSFVRRMSVHRAATVGPNSDLNQVAIKNTQACKDVLESSSHTSLHMPRSQSVVTPSHVQTLAPRRTDRTRLEALLVDVWSKDHLPYPRMLRRSDPIRASANHVIRKFSMASITSNFSSTKRSASYSSISQSRKEDVVPTAKLTKNMTAREARQVTRPPLVNFHNAPEAFLPADFELQDPVTKRKKSALRTLTMTMERPFSPLLGGSERQSSLRRAQSTRDVAGDDGDGRPESRMKTPIPAIVMDRPETSMSTQEDAGTTKSPRKSKSRHKLMRIFGQNKGAPLDRH